MSKEHRDYNLCKLFWCSPSELDNVSEETLQLYWEFRYAELKHESLESKRQAQKKSFN